MASPSTHHSGLSVSSAGNLRAIEAAQGCCDIGQQRRCDQVTADQTDQTPAASASDTSSITNTVFSMRADTPQARKRPQHRQALLEGKANRRIDDE